jgi:hypothetical protein
MTLTETETMTPDQALDILRSLVFEHERHCVEWADMSREMAESFTEDAHAALVVLQRLADRDEAGVSATEEDTLG